jgi:SNF2 family DNA or RNA helicase
MLVHEATKRKLKFCVLDGQANDKQREEMVRAYQAGFFDMMFAHPKSAAHGLTLTRGTRTIWPCPTYDLELFKQGNKRQHRLGQTRKTEIIIVTANDTVEQKVYENMLAKDARMTNLLDLFATLGKK